MFRGTCIGLSEYLVQIPQKKEAAKQLFICYLIHYVFFIFIILSNRYFCASRLGVLYGMYG